MPRRRALRRRLSQRDARRRARSARAAMVVSATAGGERRPARGDRDVAARSSLAGDRRGRQRRRHPARVEGAGREAVASGAARLIEAFGRFGGKRIFATEICSAQAFDIPMVAARCRYLDLCTRRRAA